MSGERRLDKYLPRVVLRHLAEYPDARVRSIEATVVFADLSGFTALSERLARQGRRGAEELAETVGGSLTTLLTVAYDEGGSLLKLGGDALLLLFERQGHAERACRAAVGMRRTLREIGRLRTGAGRVTLRMSQGVHSGTFHSFLVGTSHREHLLVGPAASAVVRMEKAADAGEIVISPATAELLPERCAGAPKGPGVLLKAEPSMATAQVEPPYSPPSLEAVAGCLPVMVRSHVIAGGQPSEHRNVTIAFVRFAGTDQLIEREGVDAAADALEELVADVQQAVDRHEICFLDSDAEDGGGKLLLTAGAPRIIGDDEERMLLALRQVIEGDRRLAVSVGVNRGNVFAGEIGPHYRRTYSVMGDAVNLAARVTTNAPPGELHSTAGALERSPTRFRTVPQEPFAAKGKAEAVRAWSVGAPVAGRTPTIAIRFPLVGRDPETVALVGALDDARAGHGRFVEIVGEPGIGKTRLAEELRERADDLERISATAEAFSVSTPYFAWRELLREAIGVGWEDADDVVIARLAESVGEHAPGLVPWLPLIAVPFDVDPPSTPEVDALAPEFRRARLNQTLIAFLRGLLDRPTLIEVDDAQFLDEASIDLFAAVAREVGTAPWLVVLVGRDTDALSAQLSPATIRLEPGPLASAETHALAEAVTDDAPLNPALIDLAVERSGGNPQFLRDLLRAAADGDADELPENLEAAAMARIDRLDPEDRTILRHASVLGLSFHPRFLTEILGEEIPAPTEHTWARLEPFFQDDGDGHLRFRRVIVRDAAYAGLPYRARRRLHGAAGRRMEREYASTLDEVGGILSLHFHRAGERAKAWRYAREAARRARDRGAFAAASDLYRRGLDSARSLGVAPEDLATTWEELGEAQARAGEVTSAVEAFGRARRLLSEDPVRTARLMHRTAWVHERVGHTARAFRWGRRGLRALDGVSGREAARERAGLTTTLAAVRRQQGRAAEAERLCREAIAEARRAGDDLLRARAYFNLDSALVDLDRPAEATHSAAALEIYTRAGNSEREAAVLNNLGSFAYWEGRWRDAVELFARAAEASERAGDAWAAAYGDCNIGEVLADQGRFDEAEERLRRARRIWRGTEDAHGVAFSSALLGRLAARAGRHEEAAELLSGAARDFHELQARSDAALADAYRAEAALYAGRAEEALAQADRQLADGIGPRALLLRVRACAMLRFGRSEDATTAFEEALARARARDERYEVALILDAMIVRGRAPPEAVGERDEIVRALGIARLPTPQSPDGHSAGQRDTASSDQR